MTNPLGDHQTIDAVSREVFHVAIEQTRAFTVQYAVAITNDGPDRRARSLHCDLSDSSWRPVANLVVTGHQLYGVDLIGKGKLFDGDLILIRMAGPGAVH